MREWPKRSAEKIKARPVAWLVHEFHASPAVADRQNPASLLAFRRRGRLLGRRRRLSLRRRGIRPLRHVLHIVLHHVRGLLAGFLHHRRFFFTLATTA